MLCVQRWSDARPGSMPGVGKYNNTENPEQGGFLYYIESSNHRPVRSRSATPKSCLWAAKGSTLLRRHLLRLSILYYLSVDQRIQKVKLGSSNLTNF